MGGANAQTIKLSLDVTPCEIRYFKEVLNRFGRTSFPTFMNTPLHHEAPLSKVYKWKGGIESAFKLHNIVAILIISWRGKKQI